MCEECGRRVATAFTFAAEKPAGSRWRFTCDCTQGGETYFVRFGEPGGLFTSPSDTVEWLAHLADKPWMDWNDFAAMMRRLRQATDPAPPRCIS